MTYTPGRLGTMQAVTSFCVLCFCFAASAASPIQWQGDFGGDGQELLYCAQQTTDGGYVLGGASGSAASGNKTAPNYGGNDFWAVRLGADGRKLWDKSFGGTGNEIVFSLRETSDGGFVLGGYSTSGVNGNKTSTSYGARDFWIVRVDADGNRLWDQSFGGAGDDTLLALVQTADGGFLCAGDSNSAPGGNKTSPNYGGTDFWLVRLNSSGQKLWNKTFGGTNDDFCTSLQLTADGGILLAGGSFSGASGNKTSVNHGPDDTCDFWVVRLDASGNKLWDKSLGGTQDDGYDNVCLAQTPDGGIVVGGESYSGATGTKSSPSFGNDDFWVVRMDAGGNYLWERSFGGTGSDYLSSLQVTADGGLLLAGGSSSGISGNKTVPSFGLTDFWVVRTDASGNKLWDQGFGGSSNDGFYNVAAVITADKGFLLAGDSQSGLTGNKTADNFGGNDFWVLKLAGAAAAPVLRPAPQQDLAQAGFRFFLSGESSQYYMIERSTTLQPQEWLPISTNQLTGPEMELLDAGARTEPKAYYRARVWP